MTRGESTQTKVHYKGGTDDYIVFIDDVDTYNKWKKDSSVPMVQFVSSFKVFCTHKQGAQGTLDTASKTSLASEFDSEDEEEAMKFILRNGSIQNMEMPGRQGPRNDTMSSTLAK